MTFFQSIKGLLARSSFVFLYPAAGLIGLAALTTIPLQRQVGLTFRYDLILPALIFLLVISPLFLYGNRWLRLACFSALALVFLLPLSGLWSSGQSEQYLLSGVIPFSDARGYYADARSLVEGGNMFTSHSRRPLFSAFLAPILAVSGGSLQVSVALLALLAAFCAYLAVREIQAAIGSLPALFTLALLFLFYRPISGKALSEQLGFPLALLGLTFLFFSARKKNLLASLAGLFLVTLGLVARAGAFFLLPVLLAWIIWYFRGNARKNITTAVLGLAVIALGFGLNYLIHSLLVSSSAPAFGNFSYTFYGLAVGGKGWQQILVDHPELNALPEPAYSQKIMELAFQVIARKPQNLLLGAWRSWVMFFSLDDYYSLFNWVSGSRPLIDSICRLVLYFLILAGFIDGCVGIVQKKASAAKVLVFLSSLGVIFSVPFAPPLDANRMRIYASAIPFLLIMPGLGLSALIRWKKAGFLVEPRPSATPISALAAFSALLVLIALAGPFISKSAASPITPPAAGCLPGQSSIVLRLSPGSLVNLTDPEEEKVDWLPDIRLNTFITRAHNLPNWETFPIFDNLPSGKTLANEISFPERKMILFIADTSSLPPLPALIQSCGVYSGDRMVAEYNVFFADSVVKID